MSKLFYSAERTNPQPFAECKTDIEALQLALALHQSSNCTHFIQVYKLNDQGEHTCKLLDLELISN